MYREANTLCLLCAEVLSVGPDGTARHELGGAFPSGPYRAPHAPILQIQVGSESNIGTWASTLVVPYPFDPEF